MSDTFLFIVIFLKKAEPKASSPTERNMPTQLIRTADKLDLFVSENVDLHGRAERIV